MYRLTTARRLAQLRCLNASTNPPRTRLFSSAPDAPPTLTKLKTDLKTAMRAKDAPRLAVVRAILAAHLNASKTPAPVKTEGDLVALMRKLQKSSQDAVAEAQAAGRQDLVEKERVEVEILGQYIAGAGVETMSEEGLLAAAEEAVNAARAEGVAGRAILGDVMKRLTVSLEGKDVDKAAVVELVKRLTKQ